MGFTCGIVGLPNVGKTTIFNALTQIGAEATSFASHSTQPNVGMVPVPDPRLDEINRIVPAEKTVYTTLQFVDIAGLAKGASRGEGLGNKFLGHIREVEAIAHIVRCFTDPNVAEATGPADPLSDIETVNTELLLADLETLEKRKQKQEKPARSGNKEALAQLEVLQRVIGTLNNNQPARHLSFDVPSDQAYFQSLELLTLKPVLYICNIGDPADAEQDYVRQVREFAAREGAEALALAGSLENEIQEFTDPEERKTFMEEMGLEGTGLNRMIETGYHLLDLVTFFTVGGKENRAWTIRANTSAPRAAGKIHSDFEKGFIRAEVYNYDDLIKYKSEHAVKEAGLMRLEGKDYIVQDGDILHFRFNV